MKAIPITPPCPIMAAALRVSEMVTCANKDANEIIERLADGSVCIVRRVPGGKRALVICAEPHTPWRLALKELEIT